MAVTADIKIGRATYHTMKHISIFALALSVAGWTVEANAETLKAEN